MSQGALVEPIEAPEAAAGSRGPGAQAIWFGGDHGSPAPQEAPAPGAGVGPLFGWFHPASAPRRSCVVVLCNPFGYDGMVAHYAYRHLAERLAGAGIAALRFDYAGTGDSAGDDAAPARVEEWLASIERACAEARRRSGAGAVALFGLRLGGLLATSFAQRAPVDDLILFGPVTSGRVYLRELRATRLLQAGASSSAPAGSSGAPADARLDDENFGFLMTPPMRAALGTLEPLKVRSPPARRALVIPRDDLPGGERPLAEHLRACGVDVELSSAPGYALVLRGDPFTCELPERAWDEVVAWLTRGHGERATTPDERPPPGPAATWVGLVREEAVHFAGLFGVLTEPRDLAAPRARTGIALLNVGANQRTGSNRMYVTWARRWAELGYRVLRLDFSGIGDSPVTPGRRENDVYAGLTIVESRAAVDFLAARGCDRFVLGGICSGAYAAYHAAVADPRVSGIVLINLQAFHWKEGDSLEVVTRQTFNSTSSYGRRVLDSRTWRRALGGEVHVRAVLTELGKRALRRGRSELVTGGQRLGLLVESDDIARGFRAICARGGEVLLVYGSDDGGIDVMERHLGPGAKKLRGVRGFEMKIVERTDHTFTPRDAQERLRALLTEALLARFG